MKKAFLILFAASVAHANGPKYLGPTTTVNSQQTYANGYAEAQNIYHDIAYPLISVGTASTMTVTQLLTVPNGINSTDAAAFGQLHLMQAPVCQTLTSGFSTTSASFVATNSTATISPVTNLDKIFVIAAASLEVGTGGQAAFPTIERDGSNLGGTNGLMELVTTSGGDTLWPTTVMYFDSPGKTLPTGYGVYLRVTGGATAIWGASNQVAIICLFDVL